MKGDKISIHAPYRHTGKHIAEILLPRITTSGKKYAISVAGESGSGKSTTAIVLADVFEKTGFKCLILQQDDYYVYPPQTNDHNRRQDPSWHGVREVRLDFLDQHIQEILDGKREIAKPLISYNENRIDIETINVENVRVVIAEGGYVTLLKNVNTRVFIARTYLDTRADREKRARHQAELDAFTEKILQIEHEIISKHKMYADIIITKNYEVREQCTSSF